MGLVVVLGSSNSNKKLDVVHFGARKISIIPGPFFLSFEMWMNV